MSTKLQTRRKPSIRRAPIIERKGIRIVKVKGRPNLELRSRLGMAREVIGRLVNVSVRTIADVESKQRESEKLRRKYVEVERLCDGLSEVVDPASLGDWLKTPNDAFDGSKPLEVIERGEIGRLWEMLYRLRSGMPG